MRKFIYGTILMVAMAGALTGCGGNDKPEDSAKTEAVTEKDNAQTSDDKVEVDVKAAADKILADGDFKDNLGEVDKTIALSRLYGLDEAQIESCAFYTNSNATAEEIAVIKTKSPDYVETVKTAYETRVENQKTACKDYLPDEMPKLESAVIYTNGNYVVLCVSNDNAAAETVIADLFK